MTTVDVEVLTDKSAPVRTRADLAAMLPYTVVDKLFPVVLDFAFIPSRAMLAAGLRLLARIKSPGWHEAVTFSGIDVGLLLSWAWSAPTSPRDRALAEAAAGFLSPDMLHVSLPTLAASLDGDDDFSAVLDAMRIAREGLAA